MLARDLPFYQQFFSIVRPVVSEEKEKLVALASSMDELAKFIPAIDTERNIDLQPIAFDSCVVNMGNKNGDIIDTDSALATYKTFIYKFIDSEHNRQRVIGVILSASISEFGTNRILTEEDVRGTTKPFYITLGGVLWRAVNGELCDLVEDSNDPESKNYQKVSASWEVGFSGYDIVELNIKDKLLSEGVIITDADKKKALENILKANKGSGEKNGKAYYRLLNENVIAMGVGLTEKPAAEVKGIATNTDEKETSETASPADAGDTKEKNNNAKAEIISQLAENNVKVERKNIMKLTSISDITDENLKQCSASVVTDFIKSELKKADESFAAQKLEQASAAQKLQETTLSLASKVDEMNKSLEAFAKEKAEREKVDAFNSRMSEVFASYEFPDEISQIVADEVKGLASNEAFASWKTKANTIFKPYSKTALAAAKKAKADEEEAEAKASKEAEAKAAADKKEQDEKNKKNDNDADDKKKNAKASEAIASAVEGAIDNGKKDGGLPNSSSVAAQGLKERFQTAFAEDGFVFKK